MIMRWLVWVGLALAATGFLAVGALASGSGPLAAWPRRAAEVMLSPGDVHAKHADLACRACHRPQAAGLATPAGAGGPRPDVAGGASGTGSSRFTCLGAGCHEPEKDFRSAATLELHRRRADTSCQSCHPEHRGRSARLTVAFHEATPAAEARACADCHLAEGRKAHPEIEVERCALCHPSTSSWKEVSFRHADAREVACVRCHAVPDDRLHGALAGAARTSCDTCHGTERWEPARFDHGAVPASGRGTCDRCHLEEGRKAHPDIASRRCDVCHSSTADWKQVSFSHAEVAGQACVDCHRAPRDGVHGTLGESARARCDSCHSTTGWRPARFRHDLLPGGGRTQCDGCHLQQGRRAHPGISSRRCDACHVSTQSWSRVNFSHAQVSGQSCATCHRAPRTWIHSAAAGTSCSRCHSTRAWKPSTFRHPRVPEFGEHLERFGCTGCHPSGLDTAVPCERCHGRGGFFEGD